MAKYKLGDICEIVSGSTPKTGIDEYWDGNIKWITPAELNDDTYIITDSVRKITELAVKKTGLSSFPKGTVILSSRAPIGKVAIAGCEMYCNQGFKNLICSDKINSKYLYWFLKGNTAYLNSLGRGATFKEISKGIVSEIEINVPNIEKQEEAVATLEKISGIIALRKKELIVLDNLIKARFVEMFDLSNCVYKSLGECTDFVDYRGHTPELSDEGTIRMINAKSVGKGFFKYVDEFITEKTYESWMHRGFGYPGDILFVTEGHTFGNTCLIPKDMTKFALGQRVITIKGRAEIENAFLCSYMQTDMFGKDINVYRTGGTAQGIRSKDLIKVMVPIPPIEQQKDFVKFVNQVDKSKVVRQKVRIRTINISSTNVVIRI